MSATSCYAVSAATSGRALICGKDIAAIKILCLPCWASVAPAAAC